MAVKKISCILSAMALMVGLFTTNAYATDKPYTRAIITGSVVINKGDGTVVMPPSEVLETLDESEISQATGSLKIKLLDTSKNSSKAGVKFSISKIADIEKGEYQVKSQYSDVEVDLNNIKTAGDLEIAAELFKEVVSTDNVMETNTNGECSIDNLDVGVYLAYASEIADYDNITPFIISIPCWNETEGMMYDLEVIPKHTEIPEKEKSKVPATGYNDKVIVNVAVGSFCLVGSVLLFLGSKKKERK